MDWDKLGETRGNKELDTVWWNTNELRKARPCPMHSRDFWSSMSGALYKAGDAEEMTGLYRKMYDEVQDMLYDPIITVGNETMSNSDMAFETYAGTPKTMENTIQFLWELSTQTEGL